MKTIKFIAIAVLSLVLGHEVLAQGNINIINGGTNLAVVSSNEATATPIIAQGYIGGRITYPALGDTNIIVLGYTVASTGGGTNSLLSPIPHTSGYRAAAFVSNLNTNFGGITQDIGIKLGVYPVGGTPDYVLVGGTSRQLYFGGGYNGLISARSMTTNANSLWIGYSEVGTSPGQ